MQMRTSKLCQNISKTKRNKEDFEMLKHIILRLSIFIMRRRCQTKEIALHLSELPDWIELRGLK
jgi:hypothetical protein